MNSSAVERFQEPRGVALLWAGVLAGPVAWAGSFGLRYSLVPYACRTGAEYVIDLVSVAALLVIAAGAGIAWRSWSAAGRNRETGGAGVVERSRFMAISGLILCAYFAMLVVAEAVPKFVLSACH